MAKAKKTKSKRRKDAPFVPFKKRGAESDSPRVLSAKKANTLRMRSLVATIRARTNRARAQLDTFTKGVDMSDLDAYPVITKLGKPKAMPLPKPTKEPRNNNARMSLAQPRKPSPIRTRQNRCSYCQELGHNRAGCTKRPRRQPQPSLTVITGGPDTSATITFQPAFTSPPKTTIAGPTAELVADL